MASILYPMRAHIRDGRSTQCNIYGSRRSPGTHCAITQTTAADKTTGQSVLLGNSRNTSRSPIASRRCSPSLSLSLANSCMTSRLCFCLFLLYSSELGPSEWISETSWQAKQQKNWDKVPTPLSLFLSLFLSPSLWSGPPRDRGLRFHCCEQICPRKKIL